MTRIYLNLSTAELAQSVERNRHDKAELKLLLDELKRRKSTAATKVEAKARLYLAQLVLQNPSTAGPKLDPGVLPPALSTNQLPRGTADHQQPGEREAKPMNDERRWAEEAVAGLRKKLIDLSKRNPLVAFKHGGRSASHLRIVDERPDLLFQALDDGSVGFEPLPGEDQTPKDEQTPSFRIAYERARLTDEAFLAATENLGDDEKDARAWQDAERALRAEIRRQLGLPPLDYGKGVDVIALAKAHGFDPSYDLKASDDDDVEPHHDDDHIRVLLIRKELDKRLKSIWERYRTHARDTGLHTLFLVLGFVQWFEDDSSDVALHAPLLLMAVELDRQVVKGRYEYTLRSHDEGLQVNVALGELMRQRFGLEIPELREEETPESYFIRVEEVLKKGSRLSLRRFATLAVLPFPRMVLWKDLDPAQWPEGAFADHDLLPGLLGAKELGGGGTMAETFDIDDEPWADKAPPLIQPADASQHSALIDVVEGHSIAIEGPPGTGKSQTITNIIASALDAGKRVLFVAEKQAALSVVASRLKMMGFGPLLLEMHGENAHRADLYDSLRTRLAITVRSDQSALTVARQQLKHERDILRKYLAVIRRPIGALKRTAYWLAWREIYLRGRVGRDGLEQLAVRWQPERTTELDRPTLATHRSEIDNFAKAIAELDGYQSGEGRTRWALAARLGPFDQSPQLKAAGNAASAAGEMAIAQRAVEQALPLQFPPPGGATAEAVAQLDLLRGFGDVDEHVAQSALRHPDEARSLLAQQTRWRQLRRKLEEDVADASRTDDAVIASLARAIEAFSVAPDTIASSRERLAAVSQAVTDEKRTADDRKSLQELRGRAGRQQPIRSDFRRWLQKGEAIGDFDHGELSRQERCSRSAATPRTLQIARGNLPVDEYSESPFPRVPLAGYRLRLGSAEQRARPS